MTHFLICLYSWVIRVIIFARAQNNEVHGIGRHDEVPEGLGTPVAVAKPLADLQRSYRDWEAQAAFTEPLAELQRPQKNWEAPAMVAELLSELQSSYRNCEALAAIAGTFAELQRH